jgi:hypothetical protein
MLPEAPFSANFFMVDSEGLETQFTVRALNFEDGLGELSSLKIALGNLGYQTKAQWLANMPSAPKRSDVSEKSSSGATPPSSAPPKRTAPEDANGDEEDYRESTILKMVKHSKDGAEGKKISFDLFPPYGDGVSKFKFVTVYGTKHIEALGYDVEALKPETDYKVNLHCVIKKGKVYKEATDTEKAKYHWDVVRLENNE